MPIPSGQRNTALRIEQQIAVPDGQGGWWWGWGLRGMAHGAPEALSASEAIHAATLVSVLMTAWIIPFRSDLSVKDRVVIVEARKVRTLQIVSYSDPDGARAELRLTCTETLS
jgi:head-tail adaptor